MRINLITAAALAAGLVSCGQGVSENPLNSALRAAAKGSTPLVGHQDSYYYGHSWENVQNPDYDAAVRSDYLSAFGVRPDVLGSDMGHIETGADRNLDGVPFRLIREGIALQDSLGGMCTVSWHLRNPLTGGDAWDTSGGNVVENLLPGGKLHDSFEQNWLRPAADFLLSLKRSDGSLIPVIFRPWHEHTASWFWWGRDFCTNEQFVALWRMTHDYMTQAGLDNLLWAYSPDKTNIETYMERYPGDEYVDLFGLDAYIGAGPDVTVEEVRNYYKVAFGQWMDVALDHAKAHDKPFALTECGYEGIPDSKMFTQILAPALSGREVAYCLFWRNAWDKPGHFYLPYPGHDSVEDFQKAFALAGE